MKVTLTQHVGVSLRDPSKTVQVPQHAVRVDGIRVGFIGDHEGAGICFTQRLPPEQVAEIERQVELLKTSRWQGKIKSSMPAEMPPELLREEYDGITEDDFDT